MPRDPRDLENVAARALLAARWDGTVGGDAWRAAVTGLLERPGAGY